MRMKTWSSLHVFFCMLLLSIGCAGDDTVPNDDVVIDRGETVVSVPYRAYLLHDGRLLTYIAHLMGGDIFPGLVTGMEVSNDSDGAIAAEIEVAIPGYAFPVTQRVDVDPWSTVVVPDLTPAFDYNALYSVVSQVQANLEVRVRVEGAVQWQDTQSITVLPVNRVPWGLPLADGEVMDMRRFAATLITPSDRGGKVDALLRVAAEFAPNGVMDGYQSGTDEGAIAQVRAVYIALDELGQVYTNVPGSFFDQLQNVRTPAESLDSLSANCVDGTFLMAAALEALGMRPILIFVTGHVFLGVQLGTEAGAQWIAVETTLIGSGSFEDAVSAGAARYTRAVEEEDSALVGYDLFALRSVGVLPVNL